jgi:hypothetical protein
MLNRVTLELLACRAALIHELDVGMLVEPMPGNNLVDLRVEGRRIHFCTSLTRLSPHCGSISSLVRNVL